MSIIGPSGSGKSTLLRCATMLETMDSGEVDVPWEEGGLDGADGKAVYAGKKELQGDPEPVRAGVPEISTCSPFSVIKNITDAPIHVQKRDKAAGYGRPGSCSGRWDWRTRRTPTPVSSPAASASGWPSPGRWR